MSQALHLARSNRLLEIVRLFIKQSWLTA